MESRANLYVDVDVENSCLLPTDSRSTTTGFLPCVNRALLESALQPTPGWRYPLYKKWMDDKDFLKDRGWQRTKRGTIRNTLCKPFSPFAQASYIEWRYYSIITPDFHGIVGTSLFNPNNILPGFTESGLLVIVSGVVQPGDATNHSVDRNFCWMKLFPTSSLVFSGASHEHITAQHEDVTFEILQHDVGSAFLSLKGNAVPQVQLEHHSVPGTSLKPFLAEDLRRVPGAHWIVHNPAPLAAVSGKIVLDFATCSRLPCRAPYNSASDSSLFPSFVSPAVLQAAQAQGSLDLNLDGSGYYEHSFGLNPMPLHGWDFCFVPNVRGGNTLVMQTYRGSKDLRYVEVLWNEEGSQKYARFDADEFSLTWEKAFVHPDLKVSVPSVRKIVGKKGGLHLEVRNEILYHIPFLRPDKFFVRHFFISEEVSLTTWTLRDASGKLLCEVHQQPSGGETAHLRTQV